MERLEIQDLVLVKVVESYVVTYNEKIVSIGKSTMFSSIGRATASLEKVIFANFCQGHYWHKDKDNVFSKEGGCYNGSNPATLDKKFKPLAKQLTKDLLREGIFVIKKL